MTRAPPKPLALLSLLALAAGGAVVRAADAPGAAPPAAPPAPAAAPAAAAAAASTAERDAEYLAFRADFDARRFAEALPHAERVVALTEQLDARHPDLARALNNLGATHYELHDYVAAQKAYARAVALIEEAQGDLSPRLVAPLRGLALTFESTGRSDLAVPLLERAVAISRRAHGLFNPAQASLLTPLIDGYVAVGRFKDADRVEQYALQIREHEYGTGDPRLFPALQQLARWYTSTGQRVAARQTWERLKSIDADAKHPDPLGQIVALRGIAETYRLDFQEGVEPPPPPRPGELPPLQSALDLDPMRRGQSAFGPDYVLDSAGQEALEHALALAEHLEPPAPLALAVVLVDLGDWQLLAGRPERALPYYQRALPLVPADAGGAESAEGPLSRPGLLLYRHPAASTRYRDQPAALYVEKYAVAEFTVTEAGRVHDPKITEGDASDTQRSAFLYAIGHAIYRPRFVDGKAVATEQVRYRESFRQPKS